MISISLTNLTLVLGARRIFQGLNWEIQHDQKIGLIGPNGAGKSSLFKLITGEYTPEPGGAVVKARRITLGYLPQYPEFPAGQTCFQAALSANPRWAEVRAALDEVEASLGDPVVYSNPKALTRTLERQQALLEEYQSLGGDQYPQRITSVLSGLGLAPQDLHKPIDLLSGGQKKLAGLAGLLISAPDILLLDEPDNHLDLAGKTCLEGLIRSYPGAVVIISHDRYLLDSVVTHIAELEDGRITTFSGDYSTFILDKQVRQARQETLYQVQQRQIARIQAAAKRYAIWAKVYDNEKFAKRARAIENRLERIDRLERPTLERRRMQLRLNGWRGSTKVLELREVARGYDDQTVLEEVTLRLDHGERAGLIGCNGAGKSVLMRLILGREQPDLGEVILGPSVRVGYYAQEQDALDPEQTLLEVVTRAGSFSEQTAVAFLNRYLFSYRQCSQKVKELSGGERSRLQLALIVLSGANFLLLDEPTNHLDIASAEVLEAALEDFEGTVLVVSHDRYFLDQVVERILVLEDGRLTSHPGGYSDYLAGSRS